MLNIYINNIEDEQSIMAVKAMMDSVGIQPHIFEIKGIKDLQINGNLLNIAFGKKPVMAIVNTLVKEGFIDKGSYLGKPLIDEKNGFFFYGIHLDIPEIMSSDDNKYYVFEILQDMANYYHKWFPINDAINFDAVATILKEDLKQTELAIVEQEYGISTDRISTLELIDKLVEKVDFTDTGLGKSLAKFDAIKLVTNNGYTLNLVPTAREPDPINDKEVNITFKDMFSLLKVIVLTGSRSIEFFRETK